MGLFPEEIKKVHVIVHRKDLEKVLDALSERGIIHISSIKNETLLRDEDAEKQASRIVLYENRIKKILSILRPFRKKPSGIKSLLNPEKIEKMKVKKKSLEELLETTEKNLSQIEKIVLEADKKLKSFIEKIKANEMLISKLSNLRFLDVELSYVKRSEFIILKAGITRDLEILRKKVEEIGGILDYRPAGSRKERKWIVVSIFHVSLKDDANNIWQRYVENIDIPDMPGTPSQIIKKLKLENNKINREIEEIKKKLKKIADREMLKILTNLEELNIEKTKLEARSNFGKTDHVYVVSGWVLKENVKTFLEILKETTKNSFVYTLSNPSTNPEEPPTYIKTNPITKPFKPLLALFGLPKYREINPLIFLMIWFPIMFGFMLGDAGYGLIILFCSLFTFLKFGKRSSQLKEWSTIGIFLGVWTTIFGYLSNSFFGDLLPRFFNTDLPKINLFGVEIPIDGLRNPLVFLQIALILGLVHLDIGLALGIYQDLKNNRIKKLVCGKFSFIILQLFGGALIGNYLLKIWELSGTFKMVSYIMVLIGILLLAIEAKGMSFLELMGFVGDWLSYARLLALGLATAGMALAFNIVAQLFGDMIHIAVSIIILLIAHFATMALNSLGAAVHSLRLQYVEFFNRFYEGGGREFSPLKAKRKYTELV